MKLDFTKLNIGSTANNIIEPRKIFTTLSRGEKFLRPTDEQGEVLDSWFNVRNQQHTIIKMNTGSGKTLVGLLTLQSSLNENIFPAVYVTADIYLAKQVQKDAEELGITTTDDENNPLFRSGKAILVINIYKLINGLSVFGVDTEGIKIPIGAIIIDDVHACLATTENQFSLRLKAGHPVYDSLFSVFRSALAQQSEAGVLELESCDPQRSMLVPYWAWKDKQSEVVGILYEHRKEEDLLFKWPLIKEVLGLSQCAFGGGKLEIAPRYLPIDVIPAFFQAKRKIYMTATLADDGVLITHFQASPNLKLIKPKGAGGMGDRMILAPQEINPNIAEGEIKAFISEIAKTKNVVVIVPSEKRAEFWQDSASQTLTTTNIETGVEKMKGGHIGLTVLVNKYDGIDLPNNACELLVIDGLPEAYSLLERIEMSVLSGTEMQITRQIQRIEQGMGRGVRSSKDHCAILLLGAKLIQRIHSNSARSKFSSATLTQINLGREVSKQLAHEPIENFREILNYCFDQEPEWQHYSRTTLANATDDTINIIDPIIPKLREAFDMARINQWQNASEAAQDAVNLATDDITRGYLKQQLAEYVHHVNPTKSQEILLQAIKLNKQVIKPINGVTYSKIRSLAGGQASNASKFMVSNFTNVNDLVINTNALLEDLSWDSSPTKTKQFEEAIKILGLLLGFGSQRPDNETGIGPDNLWMVKESEYYVIECKSGAITDQIKKSYCNQLLSSLSWFEAEYKNSHATPIMIHPVNVFEKHASPKEDMRIIDEVCLEKLKRQIKSYVNAVAGTNEIDKPQTVLKQLEYFELTEAKFINAYTAKFIKK